MRGATGLTPPQPQRRSLHRLTPTRTPYTDSGLAGRKVGTFKAESQTRKGGHVCPRKTDWSNRTLTSYSQETAESKRKVSYPYHTPLPSRVKGGCLAQQEENG